MKNQRNSTCSKLNKNHTPTVGYSLGIQKMEGSKIPNFIHQTNREGHIHLNHTIKPCNGLSNDWIKGNSTCSKLNKNWTPTVGYSLGFQKIESSKTPNVIHQTRREGHTDLTHNIKPCIGCSSEWRNNEIQLAQNWIETTLRQWAIALESKKLKVLRHQN